MTEMISLRRVDSLVLLLIGAILVYSAVILVNAHLSGVQLGAWVWDRHQNQFSWYSRPIFIIPAAYYAYKQKLIHVIGFMTLLATSLFWFDAPANVPSTVSEYLQWEEQLFFSGDWLPLVALILVVVIFLFLLFYAFWKRNVWYGLWVINAGTIMKIVISLAFGQDAGLAAIMPSLSSLLVINLFAWFMWRRHRGKYSETK